MAVDFHKMLRELQEQNAGLLREKEDLKEKNAQLEEKVKSQRLTIEHLRRQIFGRSSERFLVDPDQLKLFEDELSQEALKELEELIRKDDPEQDEKPPKKRNGRRQLPKNLEREQVVLDLPAEERTCPHGHPRLKFGEDVTEEIEIVPAKLYVVKYVRPKYKTPDCRCQECRGVAMASLPARPIEKGRPGPGLLAHVVVSKYGDHQPLYRQSQIFARSGLTLHRSTLCDWVMLVGELLRPIVEAMKRSLFQVAFLQADETPLQVHGVKKGGTHQGYLWGYGIPWGDVVFEFTMDRSKNHPARFLEGYSGALQIDGYDGYNQAIKNGKLVRLGCFAHVRRGFHEALKESEKEASTVLATLQLLYRLERRMKEKGLGPKEKVELRRKEALPLLEGLKELLEIFKGEALPSGSLGKAIKYTLNEWPYLLSYIEVGEAEIDNNSLEQTIRPVVLGRKNYLFAGSPKGGETAAILYSLVTTCKRIGVNPWEYLRDVIDRVSTHPMSRIEELTPRGWKEARESEEKAALEKAASV